MRSSDPAIEFREVINVSPWDMKAPSPPASLLFISEWGARAGRAGSPAPRVRYLSPSTPWVAISAIESDCDLRLRVGEVSPYTTMLELTYLFGCEGDETACTAPDMQLRIYHDAGLVEAHSWAATHHHPLLRDWRQLVGQDLDQRWARNVMLNKWLEYCLDRGHCLRAASAEPNCTMSPAT